MARLARLPGPHADFDAFLHAVESPAPRKLNVPHTLRDFKVDGAKRDLIGDMAIVDPDRGRQSGRTDQGQGARNLRPRL